MKKKEVKAKGRVKAGGLYTASKVPVETAVVSVLAGKLEYRGLQLIEPISRAVRLHEIHELIITDEKVQDRRKPIQRVSYLAFVEVIKGGMILVGDKANLNGKELGTLIGFDDTHMPNHQNIILFAQKRMDGVELEVKLGDVISFLSQDSR